MSAVQALRLVVAIGAAIAFAIAGSEMTSLKSQSGNTVAELFDNAVGVFSFGMAALSIAIGLPGMAASVIARRNEPGPPPPVP